MTIKEIEKLKPGDSVKWNDPDNGLHSKELTIACIDYSDEVVMIVDMSGNYLDCPPEQLESLPYPRQYVGNYENH
jgi:hypothetical protein